MTMFEFWLGTEGTDRLFSVKAAQGKTDLTANDFAQKLLKNELHRLHPGVVRFNENGEEIR